MSVSKAIIDLGEGELYGWDASWSCLVHEARAMAYETMDFHTLEGDSRRQCVEGRSDERNTTLFSFECMPTVSHQQVQVWFVKVGSIGY